MSLNHILFIYVDPNDKLYEWYKSAISSRNIEDSGFDLFCPDTTEFTPNQSQKIDFCIAGAMYSLGPFELERVLNNISLLKTCGCGYYLYPRSSISKTNFRLSNSVGIIDKGYRGTLGAYFDAAPWSNDNFIMNEKMRIVQLCHPTLEPFHVIMVDSIDKLGISVRGAGGFGSTGF